MRRKTLTRSCRWDRLDLRASRHEIFGGARCSTSLRRVWPPFDHEAHDRPSETSVDDRSGRIPGPIGLRGASRDRARLADHRESGSFTDASSGYHRRRSIHGPIPKRWSIRTALDLLGRKPSPEFSISGPGTARSSITFARRTAAKRRPWPPIFRWRPCNRPRRSALRSAMGWIDRLQIRADAPGSMGVDGPFRPDYFQSALPIESLYTKSNPSRSEVQDFDPHRALDGWLGRSRFAYRHDRSGVQSHLCGLKG